MSDKEHSEASRKQQPETAALSPTEETQLQQRLASYHQTAEALRASQNTAALEEALAPITSLDTSVQLALVKALGKERDVAAADVAQALHTMSAQKEVRKEARRTMLRLESANIYAEWTPPPTSSLSDTLSLFSQPSATRAMREDDEETPQRHPNDVFSSFESYLSESGLFPGDEYIDTVTDFLESWAEGNFEDAYSLLATTSPLREEATDEDWAARRQQWVEHAHPRHLRIAFIELLEDEPEEDENPIKQESAPVIDVGWSIVLDEIPQSITLPELPTATATFQENGRRWFWSRYTLVEEDEEWLVERIIDEGASIQGLSPAEVQQRMEGIKAIIDQQASELAVQEEDLDEEDFDEDDEDDELANVFDQVEEATRVTSKAIYYNDVVLSHLQDEEEIAQGCLQSVSYALVTNDPERAAAYYQQLGERVPSYRDTILPQLGQAYQRIALRYTEEENEEEDQRFTALAEKTLREAIAHTQSSAAYLALAKLLFAEDQNLDEARDLLQQARQRSNNPKELADIETGLAHIAEGQEHLEEALTHYQHVAEFDPDYPDIAFNIGTLQSKLGHYDEAIKQLQTFLQADTNQPEEISFAAAFAAQLRTAAQREDAYVALARAYMGKNDPVTARQILREGLEWDAESASLLAQLAIVYIEDNDLRSAQKYLQRAEQVDEGEEIVQQARELYNERKGQPRLRFSVKSQKNKKKK